MRAYNARPPLGRVCHADRGRDGRICTRGTTYSGRASKRHAVESIASRRTGYRAIGRLPAPRAPESSPVSVRLAYQLRYRIVSHLGYVQVNGVSGKWRSLSFVVASDFYSPGI